MLSRCIGSPIRLCRKIRFQHLWARLLRLLVKLIRLRRMFYTWKRMMVSHKFNNIFRALITNISFFIYLIETGIKVIKFKGDPEKMRSGAVMEIRGIVNKDNTISYGEFTQYDNDFDLATYETMLVYYHGMCRDLCLKWKWN